MWEHISCLLDILLRMLFAGWKHFFSVWIEKLFKIETSQFVLEKTQEVTAIWRRDEKQMVSNFRDQIHLGFFYEKMILWNWTPYCRPLMLTIWIPAMPNSQMVIVFYNQILPSTSQWFHCLFLSITTLTSKQVLQLKNLVDHLCF